MTTRGREVQPPQFQMVIDSTSGATGMSIRFARCSWQ